MTKARDNANNWAADITGVTAGTGITGGGTSGTVTVTNELVTTIDAAGDLLYGTGSDAAARLAIGTAGQLLAVNSGATAPEWVAAPSGGATLLSTTTLSGTIVDITSISQDYTNLLIIAYKVTGLVGQQLNILLRNGSTNQNVSFGGTRAFTATSTASEYTNNTSEIKPGLGVNLNTTDTDNIFVVDVRNYTRAAADERGFEIKSALTDSSSVNGIGQGFGIIEGSAAINAVRFTIAGGETFGGGTVQIWGY